MENSISLLVHAAVKKGEFASLQRLLSDIEAATARELGALTYEWFLDQDETTVVIFERFVDSDATVTHLETFRSRFGDRLAACVNLGAFLVFGLPNPQLRGLLDMSDATYLNPSGGFSRTVNS